MAKKGDRVKRKKHVKGEIWQIGRRHTWRELWIVALGL
jgi:hypothetical protein